MVRAPVSPESHGEENTQPTPKDTAHTRTYVRVRRARGWLRRRERWKGFLLFTIFFVTYLVRCNIQIDWNFAGETINILDVASQVDGHEVFTELDSLDGLQNFLQNIVSEIGASLFLTCPVCRFGITPFNQDIKFLSLGEFVCSDFESSTGTSDYPDRDCDAADRTWAARPQVTAAPCCRNSTLVKASLVMMSAWTINGTQESGLEVLVQDGEDQRTIVRQYILENILSANTFLQAVISREQRMAGISYHVEQKFSNWAPDVILSSKSFWSARFDQDTLVRVLEVFTWIFQIGSIAHNLSEMWSAYPTVHEALKTFQSPYSVVVALTMLLPAVVMITHEFLDQWTWSYLVSGSQLIMLTRFFLEGDVIPPCRLLVRTIMTAATQLSALSVVLCVTVMVLASAYGQQLGVFLYSDYGQAFVDVLGQFSNGPDLNEKAELYNPMGAKLLYFVTMFVLFLTMSQVFITVLMDAFEAAKEDKFERELEVQIPEGFSKASQRATPRLETVYNTVIGLLTYYLPLYHGWEPQILRGLQLAILDAEKDDPDMVGQPLLLSAEKLGEHLMRVNAGAALERLAMRFGAHKDQDSGSIADNAQANAVDELANKRGDIFAACIRAGISLPYADLAKMSPDVLASLQTSISTVDPGLPQVALPPGWETSIDKSRNRRYYFNRASGHRQWTSPLPGLKAGASVLADPSRGHVPLPSSKHAEQSPTPAPLAHPASISTSGDEAEPPPVAVSIAAANGDGSDREF